LGLLTEAMPCCSAIYAYWKLSLKQKPRFSGAFFLLDKIRTGLLSRVAIVDEVAPTDHAKQAPLLRALDHLGSASHPQQVGSEG
jgi:hypothetical protein